MTMILPKSIFLHMPKTGGRWVRKVIKQLGLCVADRTTGVTHGGLETVNAEDFVTPTGQRRLVFAFIRHPVTWYQSYWTFAHANSKPSRSPLVILPRRCHNFSGYIEALASESNRECTGGRWPYSWFVQLCTEPADFVGRQECMRADLHKALSLAGEVFDPTLLYVEPDYAPTVLKGQRPADAAQYTPRALELVLAHEQAAIRRFYGPEYSPGLKETHPGGGAAEVHLPFTRPARGEAA